MNVHYSSKSIEWYTPQYIFDALQIEFDLDPCHPEKKDKTPAKHHYVLPYNDGLKLQWFGNVWLNPPYGKALNDWMPKMMQHKLGIALIPVTVMPNKLTHQWLPTADGVCFIKGRVAFVNNENTKGVNPHGSMLVAWGRQNYQSLVNSRLGICLKITE